MSIFKNKKNDLYLSDKQPLTVGGKIALAISYIFLNTMGSNSNSSNITNSDIII